jgi:hypothetical protein
MKKEDYLEKNYRLFLASFRKIDIRIFLIVFFDLVFYFLVPLIIAGTFNVLQKRAMAIKLPQTLLQLGAENAEKVVAELRAFLFLLVAMLVLMVVVIILDWTIFKGLAWCLTLKKKLNLRFFLRFFLLNLLWLGLFAALVVLFAIIFKESIVPIHIILLGLLWMYFTNIMYVFFVKKESVKSIKKAFKVAFTKAHCFILPYAVLAVLLLAIVFIANLLASLPYAVGLAITTLLMLLYLAWARFYIVEVVESI